MSTENIKTWPEKVKLFNCGHGFLEQYQNGDDESNVELYIRADVAAERENVLVETAIGYVDRYGHPTMMVHGRAVVDDSVIYSVAGLEKLK